MKLSLFRGISPRTPPHLLAPGMGVRAHNVRLDTGTLAPWRERLAVQQVDAEARTLEMVGCCAYTFSKCVSVARWLPDCPRLYVTGRSDYPEVGVLSLNDCGVEWQRLGVPAPATVPVVSYITATDYSVETSARTYVFTYVNNLGEEGAPSYASTELTVNDGQSVTVSGWTAQDSAYNVERVRLYRLSSGFRTGNEKEQEFISAYLLVDEFAVSTSTYVDTKQELDLGYALTTKEVREPPAELQQITAVDGTETLAGFVGNRLYFCKNSQPWNWPKELELTLDDNIVGLGSDDGWLYVTTTGRPYVVRGAGGGEDRPCRDVMKMDYPYADIGCGYAHSRVVTPFGLVWSTAEGLVLMSSGGVPVVITDAVLSARDWARMRPDTVRLAYWRGCLFCVTDEVSFILLMDRSNYAAEASVATMSTISDTPTDILLSDSGALLMLDSNGIIYQWDAGTTYRDYEWVTVVDTGIKYWVPSGRVEVAGAVTLTIQGDDSDTVFTRTLTTGKPFRMPRLGRNRRFWIRFAGHGEVFTMRLGVTENEEARE